MQIVSTQAIEIDGEVIEPGTVLGEITSSFYADQLQPLLFARVVSIVKQTSQKPVEKVESNQQLDDAEGDDDLIGADSNDQQPAPPPVEQPKQPSVADEFPGLSSRIAHALVAGKIESPEKLRQMVDEGFDLEDLDNIGKKAKAEVLAWLETVLPANK